MSHYHPIRVIEGVKNFLFVCTSFAYKMKSHTRGRLFGMFTTLLFHGVLVLLWHLQVLLATTGKHINFQGYCRFQFEIVKDMFKRKCSRLYSVTHNKPSQHFVFSQNTT